MIPSDSSQEGEDEENEAPVKAKRSRAEHAGEEVVYHPVKLSRNDLYRAPTVEELNQLKEAENLFHCSLLKMQVRHQTYWHEKIRIAKKCDHIFQPSYLM